MFSTNGSKLISTDVNFKNYFKVILSNKLGWTLPLSIPAAQFDDICSRLPGEDMKKVFQECYFLDENSLPPAYISVQTPTMDRKLLQELYDVLCDIMTDEEKDLYMAPCESVVCEFWKLYYD